MQEPLCATARGHGARVVLTGCGADHWFGGSNYYHADLLRRGRLLAFVQLVRGDTRLKKEYLLPPWMVFRFGLWPLLPAGVRRLARRVPRREKMPSWVNPRFGNNIGLVDRICPPVIEPLRSSFALRDDLCGSGDRAVGLGGWGGTSPAISSDVGYV